MEVFDHDMRTRATEQLRLDRELRLAVERSELALYYQPEIDLDNGRIVGVEALLRWDHPDRGMVLPSDFIPAAEGSGLIVRIGRWVLEEAVLQARSWTDRVPGLRDFNVAVNLSARQINDPDLVRSVQHVLEDYEWPAANLTLELTESILIDDAEATLEVLNELKALGVKLAIDDFGTGFSSLSYLHRFPVDIVKVDRTFVKDVQVTGDGSPVAAAVMHMSRALGLRTAAEGVEEPEQLDGLRALGCDLAQGFLFARPIPSEELEVMLRAEPQW
jgi:EAL domain-containing protein (putative c-di-GMP-specific phosphodiesterase class I)